MPPPDAMAPMSLMTFEDARPWARAVKQKVAAAKCRRGAPIRRSASSRTTSSLSAGADRHDRRVGRRRRARRQQDGSAARAGVRRRLVDRQARSDLQDAEAVHRCPPTAPCRTIYVTIPTNLKEDIWIRGVELKPTDRRVVHHIISDLVEGDGKPVDPEPKLTSDRIAQGSRRRLGGLVPGPSLRTVSKKASPERFRRAPTSCCRCTTRRSGRRWSTRRKSASCSRRSRRRSCAPAAAARCRTRRS